MNDLSIIELWPTLTMQAKVSVWIAGLVMTAWIIPAIIYIITLGNGFVSNKD